MLFVRAEGLEEGLAKGREEGREDAKQQIAINFLQLGTPCEIVAKATGLSLEEVAKLKEKEQEPATRQNLSAQEQRSETI